MSEFDLCQRTRINWFRVVVDIERSGMTQSQIGAEIGRSQTQVHIYKCMTGEPKFHVGMLLLALWRNRNSGETEVPTVES